MRSPNTTLGVAALGALLIPRNERKKRQNKSARNTLRNKLSRERKEREAEAELWIEQVRNRKR